VNAATDPLRIGALAGAAWLLVVLGAQVGRALAHGRRELFAPAAGSARRGVAWAFGPGMSPSAKESVRAHLPVWFAGVGYHLGVFTAFVSLALLLANAPARGPARPVVAVLTGLGAACGAGLLARRAVTPLLRGLSGPDDYVANLLTTAFAALACAHAQAPAAAGAFLVAATALLLYAPLGKIRHCFFFFTTRYHWGTHFGRRGVFPPAH
jgi:hypothetical protein